MKKVRITITRLEACTLYNMLLNDAERVLHNENKNISFLYAFQVVGKKIFKGFEDDRKQQKKITLMQIDVLWLYNYIANYGKLPEIVVNFWVNLGRLV